MVRTRVGYAGGTTLNPTYRNIGDHCEAIQIDYDPAVISYDALLAEFWSGHNACAAPRTGQYRSAIFCHNEAQRRAAEQSLTGRAVTTAIEPLESFAVAEDYHQMYALRRDPGLLAEFEAIYPDPSDLRDSTAAMRVNAYLAGAGTRAQALEEIGRLGLSERGRQVLLEQMGD